MDFDSALLHDRYRLGPQLGAGGQGRTFVAKDTGDGDRIVVVKQLRLGEGSSWKRFDLFEREVRVLRALDHHGIPAYLDNFESDPPGSFYLVMERAPGRTLAEIGRFDEAALRSITVRALGILAYLHNFEPPVIHRDIKPANLLRTDDGRVSLVDFGGVRDALRVSGGSTVVGTFGYMAPEQLHGAATPATDIFGLGATIVALAGGVEPEDVPRRGLRMDLRKHLPRMSSAFVNMLENMTEPDPADRPQSARQALRLLPGARRVADVTTRASQNAAASTAVVKRPAPPETEALLELDLPQPFRTVAGVMLTILGIAGGFGLWFVQRAMLPILFTLVSAFTSADGRDKLASARQSTDRAFDGARAGFRRLRGAHRRRALPPPSEQKN
jgi:serine/threonine protein kinase